jgi:cell division protein FtsB
MNRKKLLLAAVLVAPLLVFGTVAAHEEETNSDSSTQTEQTTEQTETKKKTGNEGLTLQQRLNKYKDQAKTRLNAVEKTRIQTKCKASQGVVSRVKGRITGLETSHARVYDNLVSRLTSLSTKLKAKDIDTTTLDAQITELKAKIDTFETDLAKYKEAVSDLAEMDCTADPDAFKASLETARTLRAQVAKDAQAIRAYLSDTIKPTLKAIRAEVEAKKDENTSEGGQ